MSQANAYNASQAMAGLAQTERELDEKFPNRPHNHSRTLPFHDLYLTLFNPLNDNKKKPTGPGPPRRKQGPHGPKNKTPHEIRRNIIEKFISRWRQEVGDDIYPAFRLIIPEKDRERAMYGLKEKIIGKLLVRIMRIDPNSEDGYNILNWKVPGNTSASRMAGDFAGRCYEVLSKRPMRAEVGDMTIEEVNELLDRLSAAPREEHQLPIFEEFYRRMNPHELMWLIRIILRQMKVGATEKTFLEIWHPDADSLFNVSSSLRRVCWELHSQDIRLDHDERGVTLMQCFQPQLAQFQMHSFQRMVDKMRPTESDATFWIEEKLDGERMQLHMRTDESIAGGKIFNFWSRKAKDYTYLYGNGFQDEKSALTRHIREAFSEGVENVILDGEMITWDPEQDKMVPFGTLKTAAISQQENPFSTGIRPLYRVFDILYLNGKLLTVYTLRDRRRALEASIKSVHRRMEIHAYTEATTVAAIEPQLRRVVEEASEGLVLKNPRSAYRLNERNDDWMKVKPEYMNEFGESLDCVVIGGYYGSGHRGGRLSSFLCGLRVDKAQIDRGANPLKCYSFFKVGGGFTAADYANVRHQTDGKWRDWDLKRPPTEFIELGGHERNLQYERPDVWIKPDDSVVLEVKASSIAITDQFRMGLTLRFPRFKRLRGDKSWQAALSTQEFLELKSQVEREQKEKEFTVDNSRRKRIKLNARNPLTVAGYDEVPDRAYDEPPTQVLDGLSFYVVTNALAPEAHTKAGLEQLIKNNGGKIFQSENAQEDIVCIGDRRTVKVASLQKRGHKTIIRPKWIFDCIGQSRADTGFPNFLLPLEPEHIFSPSVDSPVPTSENVDQYSDSFSRDTKITELKSIMGKMRINPRDNKSGHDFEKRLRSRHENLGRSPGWMFKGLTIYFDRLQYARNSSNTSEVEEGIPLSTLRAKMASSTARFAGASISATIDDERITHLIVDDLSDVKAIMKALSRRVPLELLVSQLTWLDRREPLVQPRVVTTEFIEQCWREMTRLDEERFAPSLKSMLP